MMRLSAWWLARCAVPLLGLAGCSQLDPLTREGVWRPVDANTTNLRAMIDQPGDMVLGRAARFSDGNQAAKAVERLRSDRVYPLPSSNISKVGAGAAGAAPAASPAPAGGAP